MRVFIGVWLSPVMRDEVMSYVIGLKREITGWKWTTSHNLHFTLKFLGEVSSKQLVTLKESLQEVRYSSIPFEIKLNRIGFFPTAARPRILWIGVSAGEKELVRLAEEIEAACQKCGFLRTDKPFQPHLTIARAREGQTQILPVNQGIKFESETNVIGFSLIESCLTEKGPIYRNIEEFKFNLNPGK